MRYLLGTGYYHRKPDDDSFRRIWIDNLMRHTQPAPTRTVMLAVGDSARSGMEHEHDWDIIPLASNLGHVHNLIGKEEPLKPHAYCGWSASVLALAMIAYNDEADFVYREQDVLAFGDYVGEMYRQLKTGKMIFGSYMERGIHRMPCAQSLFLIRHDFIPTFVAEYLLMQNDRYIGSLPEQKFATIERHNSHRVKRFSFGCDRARPIPYDDPIFYAQKLSNAELEELRRRNLI